MAGSAVLYQTLRSLSLKPGTKTKQNNKTKEKKTNKQTKNKSLQDETQKRAWVALAFEYSRIYISALF